jgi:hypothetical protein
VSPDRRSRPSSDAVVGPVADLGRFIDAGTLRDLQPHRIVLRQCCATHPATPPATRHGRSVTLARSARSADDQF